VRAEAPNLEVAQQKENELRHVMNKGNRAGGYSNNRERFVNVDLY
jgi:hypothetical protein